MAEAKKSLGGAIFALTQALALSLWSSCIKAWASHATTLHLCAWGEGLCGSAVWRMESGFGRRRKTPTAGTLMASTSSQNRWCARSSQADRWDI